MSSSNSVVSIQVTFVRHGQTDYNLKHISQGQTDVPLNEKGLNQAILAGKSLSQIHFDIIYSSDLSRAYKTAETILQENKVIQTTCNIVPEILLREMSHGIYENKPNSAGKEAAEAAGFSHTDRRNFRPPGGENQDDVEKRAREFLSKLIEKRCFNKNEGNNILVVSHGIILREVFKILLEKDIGEKVILEERKAILLKGCGPNTGISKFNLTVCSDKWEIISTKCLLFLSDEHLDI